MLILASQSPRRRELLTSLGVPFEIRVNPIDETVKPNEAAESYVSRLALEKAQCTLQAEAKNCWVLGSDTSVVVGSKILGKPESKGECIEMLTALSGNTHRVLTAIALVSQDLILDALVETKVTFVHLSDKMKDAYWRSGEPCDKAGGYGIQGLGGIFVSKIEGSYSAVVGLPLHETAKLLSQANLPIWQGELSFTDQ